MKKRVTSFLLSVCLLLSIGTFSAFATKTIETADGTLLWNPDAPPQITLEKEKVYSKDYTQEELLAYVENRLASSMRVMGELLLSCPTENAEETAAVLSALLGTEAELSLISDGETAVYAVTLDESALSEAMLTLLNEGVYADIMSLELAPESAPFLCGDINTSGDVDATDYMMVKRIVLGTYSVSDRRAALADIDGDGEINISDYMIVKRYVLGTYEITRGAIIDWINS